MEWPLITTAVIFLAAYSWQVIGEPTGRAGDIAYGIVFASWLVFIVDYAVNLILAQRRWEWFVHHLFELVVIVLPLLRPLRVLRAITVLHVLNRTIGTAVRGRILIYTASASALLVYAASLAVLDAERHTDSAINTMGDAIWWSFVTITTVGYGDMTPVTGVGRTLAVCLMLGGIALLGVVTGTLASWIVEKVSTNVDENQAATVAHVRRLEDRISELSRSLDAVAEQIGGESAATRHSEEMRTGRSTE